MMGGMAGRTGRGQPAALPGPQPPAPFARLDQPVLVLVGGPPAPDAPMWDASAREAMVQFADRTWRLCRVTGWENHGGAWLCELRWGVSGRIWQARYVYDPAKVSQPGALHKT